MAMIDRAAVNRPRLRRWPMGSASAAVARWPERGFRWRDSSLKCFIRRTKLCTRQLANSSGWFRDGLPYVLALVITVRATSEESSAAVNSVPHGKTTFGGGHRHRAIVCFARQHLSLLSGRPLHHGFVAFAQYRGRDRGCCLRHHESRRVVLSCVAPCTGTTSG